MKTKTFWNVLTKVFLLLTVVLMVACNGRKEEDVIRIGAILPLSGGGAEWGIASQNAINMAVEEWNKENPDFKFSVVFEDSKTNSKDAISALNKLISQGIKFIIGDIISSNVLAMAPIAEKNGILLISPGASNPEISFAGDNVFRTWQSDAFEAAVGASFIIDSLNWKRIAVIYLENDYGVGLANEFKTLINQRGLTPVIFDSFKVGQSNFRDIITKIRNINPEGVYLASYPDENYNFLKQLEEQKVRIKIVGTQGFVSPKIDELLPTLHFPLCYTNPIPADTSMSIVKNFITNYEQNFGSKPNITADAAYDAFYLIAQAIKIHGYDIDKVKSFLYEIKDYKGASGILTFNKYGDVEKPFEIIKNKYWSD